MKLRLLLLEECNRNCQGCCNKDWDLKSLPPCKDFSGYEMIMLTGGEPMLYPWLVKGVSQIIRKQTDTPIILYTAKVDDIKESYDVLHYIDGMTITLHEQKDVFPLINFSRIESYSSAARSLRLNIFKGVEFDWKNTLDSYWQVKDNIEWIKNCPLPKDEVFMRL